MRTVKEQVKILLIERDLKMKELVKALANKFGTSASESNFSGKLTRGSLTYNEMLEVCEVLGYEIEFKDKLSS